MEGYGAETTSMVLVSGGWMMDAAMYGLGKRNGLWKMGTVVPSAMVTNGFTMDRLRSRWCDAFSHGHPIHLYVGPGALKTEMIEYRYDIGHKRNINLNF